MNAVLENAEMREKDIEQVCAEFIAVLWICIQIFEYKAKTAHSSGSYYSLYSTFELHLYSFVNYRLPVFISTFRPSLLRTSITS